MILLILFGMPVISDSLLLALASRLPMTPLAERRLRDTAGFLGCRSDALDLNAVGRPIGRHRPTLGAYFAPRRVTTAIGVSKRI